MEKSFKNSRMGRIFPILAAVTLATSGCGSSQEEKKEISPISSVSENEDSEAGYTEADTLPVYNPDNSYDNTEEESGEEPSSRVDLEDKIDDPGYRLDNLVGMPEDERLSYVADDYPFSNLDFMHFSDEEKKCTESFIRYEELDSLGRPRQAYACLGKEMLSTAEEQKEDLSSMTPPAWHTVTYEFIEGGYLYNRCRLIGFELGGAADERNVITGTWEMYTDGLRPLEQEISQYIQETGNHVLYRITPVYVGDDLLAEGIRAEVYSVEDKGDGFKMHIFIFNRQDGVGIDHANGDSCISYAKARELRKEYRLRERTFVVDKSGGLYHMPTCRKLKSISEDSLLSFTGTAKELQDSGYEYCDVCDAY